MEHGVRKPLVGKLGGKKRPPGKTTMSSRTETKDMKQEDVP